MKVYRIETAVRPIGAAAKGARRTHCDNYLVLFGQNESLTVEAMTAQDNPLPFRKQVEDMLKTFRFESATPSR